MFQLILIVRYEKSFYNDELNGNKSMRGFRNKKVEVASTTI
jgi:hypothetical protein